jgi:hypothetical protein
MSKAWKHRLRWHRPHLADFVPFPYIILGDAPHEFYKPRCTFAELGRDCPIVQELTPPNKDRDDKVPKSI